MHKSTHLSAQSLSLDKNRAPTKMFFLTFCQIVITVSFMHGTVSADTQYFCEMWHPDLCKVKRINQHIWSREKILLLAPEPLRVHSILITESNFSSFSTDLCAQFPNLRTLEVTKSKIEGAILPAAFKNCHNLTKLVIDGNNIREIDRRSFHGLKKLTTLQLSRNNLKYIDGSTFNGLYELKVLDLSGNKLFEFDEKTARNQTKKLINLKLDGNNLLCDRLQDILDYHIEVALRHLLCPVKVAKAKEEQRGWKCLSKDKWLYAFELLNFAERQEVCQEVHKVNNTVVTYICSPGKLESKIAGIESDLVALTALTKQMLTQMTELKEESARIGQKLNEIYQKNEVEVDSVSESNLEVQVNFK